jgi:hypothetical protein
LGKQKTPTTSPLVRVFAYRLPNITPFGAIVKIKPL